MRLPELPRCRAAAVAAPRRQAGRGTGI